MKKVSEAFVRSNIKPKLKVKPLPLNRSPKISSAVSKLAKLGLIGAGMSAGPALIAYLAKQAANTRDKLGGESAMNVTKAARYGAADLFGTKNNK